VIGLEIVRDDVHAALVDGLAGLLEATSVHALIPDELALPTVWIVSPFGQRAKDPVTVVAAVEVIVAVDGAEQAQLAALDRLQGAVWVALDRIGIVYEAVGVDVLAGGPTVHGVVVRAELFVDVHTLCPPALEAAS
jgi:hypothetical protein